VTSFTLHSAVSAPGAKNNEDAYGIWPDARALRAAWVLDGVTGINDRAILPGPSDAAWFVAQVQEILPTLLADQPIHHLLATLVATLAERQEQSWINGTGPDGRETPAASFALLRQLGDRIEIARLGDCLILLEHNDGRVQLLDDAVLNDIEAGLQAKVLAMRDLGITDTAVILHEMKPSLRAVRERRNKPGGYGVLAADPACLDLLQLDTFAAASLRSILMVSDGYYRLVDIYGAMTDADLLHNTAARGAETMLADLRAIEAGDPRGERHPRLKMADDATALLLRRS
jgi:hypothetical protein